ncbi:MAG: hypothetical protein ACM3X9_06850 [Bacillota bacterium]
MARESGGNQNGAPGDRVQAGAGPEESLNFNRTGNLFIEGENLEALKLPQPELTRRIKLIYIDPPYNTGNTGWVYRGSFAASKGGCQKPARKGGSGSLALERLADIKIAAGLILIGSL